jgi:hypothetical protein
MQQVDYESTLQQFSATILECGKCLGLCHSIILNLLADSTFDDRLLTAYVAFVQAIDMSRNTVWPGYDLAMAHDPKMTPDKNERLLKSIGNFVGTWDRRLLETEFNLWRFGVVSNPPNMVQ